MPASRLCLECDKGLSALTPPDEPSPVAVCENATVESSWIRDLGEGPKTGVA